MKYLNPPDTKRLFLESGIEESVDWHKTEKILKMSSYSNFLPVPWIFSLYHCYFLSIKTNLAEPYYTFHRNYDKNFRHSLDQLLGNNDLVYEYTSIRGCQLSEK